MEQQIRFCTTADGVRIAYATVGEGPPVVYANGWPTHLELEWEDSSSRSFIESLAEGCTLIRYDSRGTGLSDREVSDFSLAALTKDLEAVVKHTELDRFDLVSLGGLAVHITMTYAAANQQRVKRLVLSTAFVRGSELSTPERQRALVDYVAQFGLPLFEMVDQAELDIEDQRAANRRQEAAAPPSTQGELVKMLFSVDVSDLTEQMTMPTLVLHGRQDRGMPFEKGRELAALLPNVTFVPFEGKSSAAWSQRNVIAPEIRRFLELDTVKEAPGPFRTVLFTDVEGSTALTDRLGDAKARELLREHESVVREALKAHGGSEVKTMGDGFMASFGSATKALECAIALQRAFEAHNESAAEAIRVRIGLNAGEPIAEDDPGGRGDLFGTAVNLAARIAAQADGGEILVADVVRQLVAGKEFLFNDRGETELRGFEDPVRVSEVRWRESD